MSDMKVPLYNCLYGMEIFKGKIVSDDAVNNCMFNAVKYYYEHHLRGETVGAIDFNRVVLDLATGELTGISLIQLDAAKNSVDMIKFLPPEIINGSAEFGEAQDRFCLALLLFTIRYFSNPFDGAKTYGSPIVSLEMAKKIYGEPVFVFDVVDNSNNVSSQTDSKLIQLWDNESNTRLKDLFTTCFTAGIKNTDMRPNEDTWLVALGMKVNVVASNSQDALYLEAEGKKIRLEYGIEVFESDLYDGGNPNNKIAVVLKSKKNEDILALGNASNDTWSVYMPDSREIMVAPKSVAPLVIGSVISIGDLLVNITSEER